MLVPSPGANTMKHLKVKNKSKLIEEINSKSLWVNVQIDRIYLKDSSSSSGANPMNFLPVIIKSEFYKL